MTQLTIGKWGNNLAVRLPSDIVQASKLHEGDRVEVEVDGGAIVIRLAAPRFILSDMFQGKTPEEWRAAYAHAYDWGPDPDLGRETVPE